MRLLKKVAVTSMLSVSMLTAASLVNVEQNSSISLGPKIVYAAEESIPSDALSALDKINSVQNDGDNPGTTKEEQSALWKVMKNPSKYIDKDTDGSTLDKLKAAMDKPKTLALGADEGDNVETVLSALQNELNAARIKRGDTEGNSIGTTDTSSRDLEELKGKETYASLYASIIYSLSKGDSADNASISLSQMMKYPVRDGDTTQQYGNLATPSFTSGNQREGSQLASYVRSLYEYNYLVMKDKTGFSGIWNFLTGWIGGAVRGFLLSTAWLGAALYDTSFNLIKWFTDSFTKFNILQVTGLQAGVAGANSFVTKIFENLFKSVGLNGETIKAIQYLIYVILFGAFALTVITQLNKAKAKRAIQTTKRFGLRILTIVMTIPLTAMMYATVSNVFSGLNMAAQDASKISDSYVINVTRWAGTLNLSFAPITSGNVRADGEIDKAYKPTVNNIAKINAASRAVEEASGGSKKSNAQSAMSTIEGIMQDKEASAQDYFNFIASRSTSGSNIAAEGFPTTTVSDSRGRTNAYLLVSRDKKDDVSQLVKIILAIANGDKDKGKANDDAGKSYTYKVANKKDVTVSLDSKYDLTPVVWNNPVSYLYGAVTPGNLTKSTLNHNNYHLSAYTNMLNDPKTGELAKDNELQKALRDNAIAFALINKYAGIKSYGGGSQSLSSQSVAFLLQSKLSDGTLVYKGYNTAANSAGSSKNTGAYGITYVENVVPSENVGDYMNKIASLNAIWLSAGIASFIVLLALIKAPILGSIMRHLKGFFSALFTGNTVALIESILYYVALSASFIFAYFGVLASLTIVMAIVGSESVMSGVAWLSFVPVFGPIFMSWLICYMLTWPVVKLKTGTSGKARSVGIAALCVSIPFLLVESMDAYFERLERNMYGKSRSQSFVGKLSRQAEVIDPKNEAKRRSKSLLNKAMDGVQTVGSAIPGYGTAAAAAAGVVKGALGADQNDPNAIIPKTENGLLGGVVDAGAKLAGIKDPNDHKDPKDPAKDGELFESEEHREKHSDLTSPKETDKIDAEELKVEHADEPTLNLEEFETPADEQSRILEEIAKNTAKFKEENPVEVEVKENDKPVESVDTDKVDAEKVDAEKVEASELDVNHHFDDHHEDRDGDLKLDELEVQHSDIKDTDIKDADIKDTEIKDGSVHLDPNAKKLETETPAEPTEVIVKDQEKDLKTNDDSEKEIKSTLDPNGLKVENKISEGLVNSKLAKTEADQHGLNEFGNLLNSAMQKVKDAPEGMKNIPDTLKATVDPITSSELGRKVGDGITAALTGKPLSQVQMERHTERVEHDREKVVKQQSKELEKQILRETLVAENMSKGMSAEMAKMMAGVQEAVGKVASTPVAKAAHTAAKPFAFAMDKTLFDGDAIAQKVLNGQKVEDKDQRSSRSTRSESETQMSERQSRMLADAIDRLSDDIRDQNDQRR